MAVTLTKKSIGDGIDLHIMTDPKFKSCCFRFCFIIPHTAETAEANSMIAYILDSTNSDYPDLTSFNSRLAGLYGASFRTNISRYGDDRQIAFVSASISDRYALDGECISMELLKLLCGSIFNPVLDDDGLFPAKQFEIKRKEMIDDIKSDINDKKEYAYKKAVERVYDGETSGIALKGTVERTEALTRQQVYDAYRAMLRNARVMIYYTGNEMPAECEEYIRNCFGTVERDNIYVSNVTPSPLKDKVCEASDVMDITQNKMVMALKFRDNYPETVVKLFTVVFGASPFSLLFKNVREKMSLCYYCSSSPSMTKRTIFVESGLEAENTETARNEILNQLETIKRGEISDELLEQSKLILKSAISTVEDTPTSVFHWYHDRSYFDSVLSPAEYIEQLSKVTKEQIVEFADTLCLDTVYVLKGSE